MDKLGISEKKYWSRDEVVELIREAVKIEYLVEKDERWADEYTLECTFYSINEKEFNEWIKENL